MLHSATLEADNLNGLSKKARSKNPELRAFGAWLFDRRGHKTREQVSIALEKKGAPLGGSTLAQYEKGAVWAPDPAVLWGLAQIYGQPIDYMLELLATNRAHPELEKPDALIDLIRHAGTGKGTSHRRRGGTDVPASVSAFAERIARDTTLGREMQDALVRLTKVAATLLEESGEVESAPTGSAPRDRKTS